MTEKNTDSAKSLDPGKAGFEFLKELLQTPYLYILSLGALLVIFSLTRNIPWIGKVPTWGAPILLLFGGWLSYIATRLYHRENKYKELQNKYNQANISLTNEGEKVKTLSTSIDEVLEILERKEELSSTDRHILDIISRKTMSILEDLKEGSGRQAIASDWFKGQIYLWMRFIRESSYEVLDNRKRESFFLDMERHLDLLARNLEKDVYRTPSVDNLSRSVDDISLYIRAFQDLKSEVQFSMQRNDSLLGYSGKEYINRHFDAFIELINF